MTERKIKILRIMRGLNVGGIELRIMSLTRELNRTGDYESEIITIMNEGDLADEARAWGVPVRYIPVPHRTNLKGLLSLRRYIREHHFDIVHTHSFYPNVPGRIAAVLARAPIIVAHQHSLYSRKCRHKKHRWYEKILEPFTDLIIAVSRSVKDDYVAFTGVSEDKVCVMHNGVDLAPFRRGFETAALRRELGLAGKFVIGSVGRLVWVKGYPYLIKAARRVVDTIPDAVFVIVGDGPEQYKNNLIKQIQELGLQDRVNLIGYRKDIPALMHMFDMGVLPSRFEGFPAVLVEFLASGKPVVATNTGGQTEIVTDGKDALLVKPGAADELAKAIIRLAQDEKLRNDLTANARITAEEFSLEKMTANFDRLYKDLMSSHR